MDLALDDVQTGPLMLKPGGLLETMENVGNLVGLMIIGNYQYLSTFFEAGGRALWLASSCAADEGVGVANRQYMSRDNVDSGTTLQISRLDNHVVHYFFGDIIVSPSELGPLRTFHHEGLQAVLNTEQIAIVLTLSDGISANHPHIVTAIRIFMEKVATYKEAAPGPTAVTAVIKANPPCTTTQLNQVAANDEHWVVHDPLANPQISRESFKVDVDTDVTMEKKSFTFFTNKNLMVLMA